MWPRGHRLRAPLPPGIKPPTRDITGEAVSELEKALELRRRNWPAHRAYGESTM